MSQRDSVASFTRRDCLKRAAGAFMILPSGLARGYAANDRPNVGIIGLAGQGVRDARALEKARANVAALCDVDCEMPDQRATESTSAARTLRTVELIQSGALGQITEVHATTGRPIWPQGCDRPPGEDVPPRTLDWDLWLAPAPHRPFLARYPVGHPVYNPAPEKRHQSDFKDAGLSPVPPLGAC